MFKDNWTKTYSFILEAQNRCLLSSESTEGVKSSNVMFNYRTKHSHFALSYLQP